MKLRARLALAVLVTALPVIGGIVFLQQRLQWNAVEQSLADYALDRMQGGGREAGYAGDQRRCERGACSH